MTDTTPKAHFERAVIDGEDGATYEIRVGDRVKAGRSSPYVGLTGTVTHICVEVSGPTCLRIMVEPDDDPEARRVAGIFGWPLEGGGRFVPPRDLGLPVRCVLPIDYVEG